MPMEQFLGLLRQRMSGARGRGEAERSPVGRVA
jgi:hypothetical protein